MTVLMSRFSLKIPVRPVIFRLIFIYRIELIYEKWSENYDKLPQKYGKWLENYDKWPKCCWFLKYFFYIF